MSLALRPSAKSLGQNAHRTKPRSPALPTPNARARVVRTLAITLLASCCLPLCAWAAPGSGTASIVPTAPVPAGATGTWTIRYVAAEDFAPAQGGWVYVQIPPGWTAPQITQPTQAG